MSNDQDFGAFSERVNIRQIYEDLGCLPEFKHENVLYKCRNGRFILTRFPADHPAKGSYALQYSMENAIDYVIVG